MEPTKLDLLFFSAHPDDVEIACSGTLLKHIKMGYKAGIIDLTRGDLGTRGSADIRDKEAEASSKVLGLSVRENLNLGDGVFDNNHETRLKVIEVIRKYRPEVIFMNASNDRHPDHGRAGQLQAEAYFYSGLPKIVTQHPAWRPKAAYHYIQDVRLEPDFLVDITAEIDQKFEALMCYSSQFHDPNSDEPETSISTPEFLNFLRARVADFGRPIGAAYAEGFICHRTPGVRDVLKDLV